MGSYSDYCPIAVANEVVGDRWSPLVLREIMIGAHRFNDIHRGIPKMSRTLLAQRLRLLEKAGVVERRPLPGQQSVDYTLTEAGLELEPILWDLGRWASKWLIGDPEDEQLDAVHLVWRLHQRSNSDNAPEDRTTIEFRAYGPGGGRAWLVFQDRISTACQVDPGYEIDLLVSADNRQLHRWFLGRTSWREACDAGDIEVIGPRRLRAEFPRWFDRSPFQPDVSRAMKSQHARAARQKLVTQ